jgi:hypothetical protein
VLPEWVKSQSGLAQRHNSLFLFSFGLIQIKVSNFRKL